MNIRLDLQFDGTDFSGWQIQPDCRTVQGVLADTLSKVTGEEVMPKGCSRTDAGVHAQNFVCNFHTNSTIPPERMPFALNTFLPSDIICTNAVMVPDDFSANGSAKRKTYRYTIDNNQFANVFTNRFFWHYKYKLDVYRMQQAANHFRGTHDFLGFASSGLTVKTTVRTIYDISVRFNENIITIDVTGNGFLYNMVRIIVGTLIYAGSNKLDPDDIPDIINSRDRSRAGITAPAKGLCLKEVIY